MNTFQQLLAVSLLATSAALITGCSTQDTPPAVDEHAQHHPAGDSGSVQVLADKPEQCKMMGDKMSGMGAHKKEMCALHEKMAAAKTDEERAVLKAECKKLKEKMASDAQTE